MKTVNRRQFLEVCGGAAAGATLLPALARAASASPSVQFPSNPRERVAVAAYPFREFILGWKGWDGKSPSSIPSAQQIELKDFAAHVVAKFNIHKIEPWSRIFPSTEPRYLDQFRAAAEKAGSAVVDIAVDGEDSQYSSDDAERQRALIFSKHWIDVGAALGSPSIRTHIEGSKQLMPDASRAAETLQEVAEYASRKNVVVHLKTIIPSVRTHSSSFKSSKR
jgi:hypothetical protein